MLRDHPRIAVVGTSCSGKTTLASQLAAAFGRTHIELDALHWGPDWTERADFPDRVSEVVRGEEWITDGNYRAVRELVWSRATALVWLNYPFRVVFTRALLRTTKRLVTRETLYSGNRESFRGAFFEWDGIPWWVIRTHRRRRREYPVQFRRPQFAHLEVFEINSPLDAVALVERETLLKDVPL
jgi:adenylate kinase family enzyme